MVSGSCWRRPCRRSYRPRPDRRRAVHDLAAHCCRSACRLAAGRYCCRHVIGAVLELIWVLDMPVGTFVPADATVGAVSATAIAALGRAPAVRHSIVIGFSILLTTAMVPITMMADAYVRKRNSRLVAAAHAGNGEDPGAEAVPGAPYRAWFVFSEVVRALSAAHPGRTCCRCFFCGCRHTVHRAMALFVKLLPLLGAALVLHKLSISVLDRFLLTGFMAAASGVRWCFLCIR